MPDDFDDPIAEQIRGLRLWATPEESKIGKIDTTIALEKDKDLKLKVDPLVIVFKGMRQMRISKG